MATAISSASRIAVAAQARRWRSVVDKACGAAGLCEDDDGSVIFFGGGGMAVLAGYRIRTAVQLTSHQADSWQWGLTLIHPFRLVQRLLTII